MGMSQKDQITMVQQIFDEFKVDWEEGARENIKVSLQQPALDIFHKRKMHFDSIIGAIVLTFRQREGVKKQSYVKQISRERSEGVEVLEVPSNKGVKIDD